MPQCMYCGTHLQTRKSLRRHCEALHHGRRISEQHTPEKVVLTFFTNLSQQSLSCPLSYCSFAKFGCKNTKLLAKHFTSSHPYHELVIQHYCQTCSSYIDPAERRQHNRAHIELSLNGTPLDHLVPHINKHDDSLEFVEPFSSPPVNISSPADSIRLAPTPPYKLPTFDKSLSDIIKTPSSCSLSPPSHALNSVPTSHQCDGSPTPSTKMSSPASSPPSTDVNLPSPLTPTFLDSSSGQFADVRDWDVISIGTGSPVPDLPTSPSPSTNELAPSIDVDAPTVPLAPAPTIVAHSQPLLEQSTQDYTPSVMDSNVPLSSQPTPTFLDPSSREFTDSVNSRTVTNGARPEGNRSPVSIISSSSPMSAAHSSQVHTNNLDELCTSQERAALASALGALLCPNEMVSQLAPVCDQRSVIICDCPDKVDVEHECSGDIVHDTREVVIMEERLKITDEINTKLARLRATLDSEDVDSQLSLSPTRTPTFLTSSTTSVDDLNALRGCMDTSVIPNSSVAQPSLIPSSRESDDFAIAPPATRLRNIIQRDRRVSFASKLSETLRPQGTTKTTRQHPVSADQSIWINGDPWYDPAVLNPSSTDCPDAKSDVVDTSSTNEDDNDDSDIPSAQPGPPRPPDLVAPELVHPQSPTLNAADSDDDAFFNDSQELPPEDLDLQRLISFRQKWLDIFSQDSSWVDFSKNCETFAAETTSLATFLNKPPSARRASETPKPPPPRRPSNGRRIASFDPAAARRIQGLYRHSKKRAARKLLSDNAVSYSGSIEDAQTYFTDVFSAKYANLSILQEGLNDYVPPGQDH